MHSAGKRPTRSSSNDLRTKRLVYDSSTKNHLPSTYTIYQHMYCQHSARSFHTHTTYSIIRIASSALWAFFVYIAFIHIVATHLPLIRISIFILTSRLASLDFPQVDKTAVCRRARSRPVPPNNHRLTNRVTMHILGNMTIDCPTLLLGMCYSFQPERVDDGAAV